MPFSIQAFLTKIFALFFGAVTFGVTFVIRFPKHLKDANNPLPLISRYLPGMLEAAIVIGGVVNGPIIGIFTAGRVREAFKDYNLTPPPCRNFCCLKPNKKSTTQKDD